MFHLICYQVVLAPNQRSAIQPHFEQQRKAQSFETLGFSLPVNPIVISDGIY
jgi:hypothetical protein